jgi:hypothetical protein
MDEILSYLCSSVFICGNISALLSGRTYFAGRVAAMAE